MDKATFDYVTERAEVLATANTSKQETKDAAAAWKAAVEADGSDAAVDAATVELLDFLKGRPTDIDSVIAFAGGRAKELFGEEYAADMLDKQTQRKAEGAKFCDCASCAAASEILAKFGRVKL